MSGSIYGRIHRHKVFISYHHENDQWYRDAFEKMFAGANNIMVSKSVQIGDIDDGLSVDRIRRIIREQYIRDATVTVVLVGKDTWRRKHVDWEIGASIRQTEYSPRAGLLGVLLPTYPGYSSSSYNPYTIPPRLYRNIECGYAKLYSWNENANLVADWIQLAYETRKIKNPDNSYQSYGNNRNGDMWYP